MMPTEEAVSVDATCRRPIHWRCAAMTHTGCVRKVNEDALLSTADHWAVADGMGGHQVGDVASGKIIEALKSLTVPESLAEAVDCVDDCLQAINAELQHYAREVLGGATMGSTLVDLIIRGRLGVGLWAGDSRLYRYRQQRLELLTTDHSQVEDMVRQGLIHRGQARSHECSNVITRAVGVEASIKLDLRVFDVQVGDLFLLCSDGLHGVISDSQIEQTLRHRDPERCSQVLLNAVLDEGAPDNVSMIIVRGELGPVAMDVPSTRTRLSRWKALTDDGPS
ncbi:PP2C family protein-serine/threonine phosphatase [Marinimicrobium sp. ARAG 43.8]|uniref:PP2C family protein-serine/threonine phosphatase n=1 Tax=Marinimicrobium sp. ARAG 43.8 TaxID=3418719 RepID=UPI003CF6E5B4